MDNNVDYKELEDYIANNSLEDYVRLIYSIGKPRPLFGENSVMLRTLGENFSWPNSYQTHYFDELRKEEAMTEFAEFHEELRKYDDSKTKDNKIELILEAGDILFQNMVLEIRHKENPNYKIAKEKMDLAMFYVTKELKKRGISQEVILKMAKIKYGIRSYMRIKGLPQKNKDLEKRLCLEELEKK